MRRKRSQLQRNSKELDNREFRSWRRKSEIRKGPSKTWINVDQWTHSFSERKKVKSLSRIRLFATPWTVAYQPPLSMGFSRQECWSRLPFPSPGDFPNPGIEPGSPALEADALPSEPPGKLILLQWVRPNFPIHETWKLLLTGMHGAL